MATDGATLITALARRLRDTSNTAHPRDLLRRVLSHSQRAINLAQQLKKTTATFTPDAGRTLYEIGEVAANVGRIVRIRAADRTLPEISWRQLVDNSRTWFRDIDTQHRTWSRIGGNLFVLTPALIVPSATEVVYVIVPADVVDDTTNVDVPDEWLPLVMDMAEALMLLRARLYHALDGPMSRIASTLSIKPPLSTTKESA